MKHITTLAEAKAFLDQVIKYLGMSFHPDDSFAYYPEMYSPEQALIADTKLGEAFEQFELAEEDIYEYCLNQL